MNLGLVDRIRTLFRRRRLHKPIAQMDARLGDQADRPKDTGDVPVVLIFQPGPIRPPQHLHGNRILAGLHKRRQVKLGRQFAVLRIPHRLAVDP